MDDTREAVEDLIEETRLREMTDDQIERRIRRFASICEDIIGERVSNERQRTFLLERLEILKCLYDQPAMQNTYPGLREQTENQKRRNKRLNNVVRKRRLALQMIERTDPALAREIERRLEEVTGVSFPLDDKGHSGKRKSRQFADFSMDREYVSSHQWFFLAFNVMLMIFLITALVLLVV